MALTSYLFNFSQTQTGKFDFDRFENQIMYSRNYGFSDFTIVMDRIDVNNTLQTFTVWFKNALPNDEVTNLNNIVAAHRGNALRPTFNFKLDAPSEFDNRPNIVINPAPFYWRTYFTGAGDNKNPTPPASGRGEGTPVYLEFTVPEVKYMEMEFIEPILIHDCQAQWYPVENWDSRDKFTLSSIIPANSPVLNGSNTGNVNLLDTGYGYSVIMPATNNNGTHDLNLSTAVPAPTNGDGFWNVDFATGAVTPNSVRGTDWHLLNIPLSVSYIKNIPLGSQIGMLDIETYKADYFHNRWKIRVSVEKVSTGAGTFSGWFMCFRQYLT